MMNGTLRKFKSSQRHGVIKKNVQMKRRIIHGAEKPDEQGPTNRPNQCSTSPPRRRLSLSEFADRVSGALVLSPVELSTLRRN